MGAFRGITNRKLATTAGLLLLMGVGGSGCPNLTLLGLPDFATWPVNTSGYTIEKLPISISASYARGHDVYLADPAGIIFKIDDRDLGEPWESLGQAPDRGLHMLFVSRSGTLFTSAIDHPTYRSTDNGMTWNMTLGFHVWRMDGDELGNLYAGNYNNKDDQHFTRLYKSSDEGASWTEVFREADNDHIHTVRWDDKAKRVYIAFGDKATRGQAFSDDRGDSFHIFASGFGQGHTDVAFTNDYVIWASDDQSGRVFRIARDSGRTEALMGRSQFMWFAVASEKQIYVGTVTSRPEGGERAALLASDDQGDTWQKLIETATSSGPFEKAFLAESRELSSGGWLYCTGDTTSYRIRRTMK